MKLRLTDIQMAVCRHFGITSDDLLGDGRERKFAEPRQICFYLARRLTTLSAAQIGRRMNRDHSTVLYGIMITAKRYEEQSYFWRNINKLWLDLTERRDAA